MMEMNIIKKEPKYNLYDCLNDCSLEMLKFLYKVHKSTNSKKLNTRKEYIDYLNKKIPQEFRKYLTIEFKFSAYKALLNSFKKVY